MKIVLPGERPISWNKLYSGNMHWTKRAHLAEAIHWLVRAALDPMDGIEPYTDPVRITMKAYFGNRPLDADNICSKLYIDGLIGRVIVDDGPEHVKSVTTETHVDKEHPRVELVVTPARVLE